MPLRMRRLIARARVEYSAEPTTEGGRSAQKSVTAIVQAVCKRSMRSTSTRHSRQAATSDRPGTSKGRDFDACTIGYVYEQFSHTRLGRLAVYRARDR